MPTPTQRLNGLELPAIMNCQDISQESSESFEGKAMFISSVFHSF